MHTKSSKLSDVKKYQDADQVRIAFGVILKTAKLPHCLIGLPDWGAKDLKLGTLRAVIRQLGLDWQEFLKK